LTVEEAEAYEKIAFSHPEETTDAFSSSTVAVYGFAMIGLSFLLYGAFRHFTKTESGDYAHIETV